VNVTDVLSGTVNARLKLKFLFFSKSWRKQLFKFDGFCEDGCNHALFAEQCNLGAPPGRSHQISHEIDRLCDGLGKQV
jgi:hypothetical protein